ncbi:4942_t:CDS:2, partial [Paraglomus brasilianum]
DKEVDEFLGSKYKEKVSNEIRERNREKKLRDQETYNTSLAMSILPIPPVPLVSTDSSREAKTVSSGNDQRKVLSKSSELIQIGPDDRVFNDGKDISMTVPKLTSLVLPKFQRPSFQSVHQIWLACLKKQSRQVRKKFYVGINYSLEIESKFSLLWMKSEKNKIGLPPITQPKKTTLVIPYDTCASYINTVLKEHPYLSLRHSDEFNDCYEFNDSGVCPGCEKEHSKGYVFGIVGQCRNGSYYVKCRNLLHEKEISKVGTAKMSISSTSQVLDSSDLKTQTSIPPTSQPKKALPEKQNNLTPMTMLFSAIKHWNNILIYIMNSAVKMLIIMELLPRHYVLYAS